MDYSEASEMRHVTSADSISSHAANAFHVAHLAQSWGVADLCLLPPRTCYQGGLYCEFLASPEHLELHSPFTLA